MKLIIINVSFITPFEYQVLEAEIPRLLLLVISMSMQKCLIYYSYILFKFRMDLEEIGINTRNWIDSAQDWDYWRALVNLWVP